MHPLRPHVQRAPPRLTTTWPISPAAPRPTQGRPSSTMPPPTPVPQNTPSSEGYGLPAPSSASASVATWTSLPSATRVPSAFDSSSPRAKVPSQSGRLRALVTVPAPASISPGEPTPTPSRSAGSTSAACAACLSAPAIAAATSAGPPLVGVGTRSSPRTVCSSSTTTAWIFVPPRSMPPRMVRAYPPTLPSSPRTMTGMTARAGDRGERATVDELRRAGGADPFAVLGVAPTASAEEVAAAYRNLAKRWHPDRAEGPQAARRMAEINAAYDLLRSERWLSRRGRSDPPAAPPAARRGRAGAWLSEPLRRALGRELLVALEDGEAVAMVTPAST